VGQPSESARVRIKASGVLLLYNYNPGKEVPMNYTPDHIVLFDGGLFQRCARSVDQALAWFGHVKTGYRCQCFAICCFLFRRGIVKYGYARAGSVVRRRGFGVDVVDNGDVIS
jgi:hypothetical protein